SRDLLQFFQPRYAIEADLHRSLGRGGDQLEAHGGRFDLPDQESLVALFAIVQAADRSRVRNQSAVLLPGLVLMDVPEQKGFRPGAEKRAGRKLVIESRHR